MVIDEDQGQSAAGAAGRAGFRRRVGEVGMGQAGIVLGLEVSRLARSSRDWHRFLKICALMDTLMSRVRPQSVYCMPNAGICPAE